MNWVMINNVKSTSIKGLQICELPPITMAPMRTNIIEVDGRDGDIVENLGLQAYDKEMKIGISGDYDIDEIIGFFSRAIEKTLVVFSNEPKRMYRTVISNQIDFERLVRFKTATVKLHVQPYKLYPGDTKTFTGEPVTSLTVENIGNYTSKPAITLYGTGVIDFCVDDKLLFSYDFKTDESVYIVSEEQTVTSLGRLRGTRMMGDFLTLTPGQHEIKIEGTGTVNKVIIYNASRWR